MRTIVVLAILLLGGSLTAQAGFFPEPPETAYTAPPDRIRVYSLDNAIQLAAACGASETVACMVEVGRYCEIHVAAVLSIGDRANAIRYFIARCSGWTP